jgi:hypothetical protein
VNRDSSAFDGRRLVCSHHHRRGLPRGNGADSAGSSHFVDKPAGWVKTLPVMRSVLTANLTTVPLRGLTTRLAYIVPGAGENTCSSRRGRLGNQRSSCSQPPPAHDL